MSKICKFKNRSKVKSLFHNLLKQSLSFSLSLSLSLSLSFCPSPSVNSRRERKGNKEKVIVTTLGYIIKTDTRRAVGPYQGHLLNYEVLLLNYVQKNGMEQSEGPSFPPATC